MPRLLYFSFMRFPNEKAHSLQIVQNCEAFSAVGYQVTLYVSARVNTPPMRAIRDPYTHYGVARTFRLRRIPVLDLMPVLRGRLERIAFPIVQLSYIAALLLLLPFLRAEVYYTRDEWIALILTWFRKQHKVAYEAHIFSQTPRGARLQQAVCRRVGSIVAITPHLAQDLIAQRGAPPGSVLIAHDGIRQARFASVPPRQQARQHIGWPQERFVVGFVGRLQMLKMDKGISTLIEAIAQVGDMCLAIVGGPDEIAQSYRAQWHALGLPPEGFLYAGSVPPDTVPTYLAAFDVCAMPHPATRQFSHYTSPLKLFEYMASGTAIVASDLPGWADVLTHNDNAMLAAPGDAAALAVCLRHLRDDAGLRERLGARARADALAHYTWEQRARAIQRHLHRLQSV
jgi:glycosyltransferase involved in cell wall biosynthesis